MSENINQSFGCPLCDQTDANENDIYVHLMVSHRKSAISNALLEATESDSLAAPEL